MSGLTSLIKMSPMERTMIKQRDIFEETWSKRLLTVSAVKTWFHREIREKVEAFHCKCVSLFPSSILMIFVDSAVLVHAQILPLSCDGIWCRVFGAQLVHTICVLLTENEQEVNQQKECGVEKNKCGFDVQIKEHKTLFMDQQNDVEMNIWTQGLGLDWSQVICIIFK